MKATARLILLLLPLAVVACDSGTGPDDEPAITGTYDLQTVNGVLPYILFEEGAERLEILQGRVTLRADSSFTDIVDFRFTEEGQVAVVADTIEGRWSRTGMAVTFQALDRGAPADPYTMSYTPETLSYSIADLTFIYRR